jgi:hypothetical protein
MSITGTSEKFGPHRLAWWAAGKGRDRRGHAGGARDAIIMSLSPAPSPSDAARSTPAGESGA